MVPCGTRLLSRGKRNNRTPKKLFSLGLRWLSRLSNISTKLKWCINGSAPNILSCLKTVRLNCRVSSSKEDFTWMMCLTRPLSNCTFSPGTLKKPSQCTLIFGRWDVLYTICALCRKTLRTSHSMHSWTFQGFLTVIVTSCGSCC